jgi:Cu(I)/Ag(I) efflux system membrane fusion protein
MNMKNGMIMAAISLCVAVVLYLGLSGKGIEFFRKKVQGFPAQIKLAVSEQTVPAEHQKSGGDSVSPVLPSSPVDEQNIIVSAGEQPQTIEITEAGQRFIGMKTTGAVGKSLDRTIRTVGRVEYDERKIATVNTKIEGWLENLRVNYTGRYVKQGEVLAEIYSPELVASQQEYLNILQWSHSGGAPAGAEGASSLTRMLAQDAEALRQAARQRLRFWDISESQIQKIEKTGQPLRTLAIFSPVNGYVVQKVAVQGMKVQSGEKLFDLVDTSTVWVVSDIYEQDLAQVRIGQKAEITLDSLPGKVFTSTIEYVSPLLAGETRTAKARFTLENQAGELKPQMFANVEIKISLGQRLVVPDTAVIDTGVRQLVYVDKGDGYFEPRTVSVGVKAEGMVEILGGLHAGEQVASAATFLVDSEARLKGEVQ